nr:hypothetical protein [uncultured Blautia sp.]
MRRNKNLEILKIKKPNVIISTGKRKKKFSKDRKTKALGAAAPGAFC